LLINKRITNNRTVIDFLNTVSQTGLEEYTDAVMKEGERGTNLQKDYMDALIHLTQNSSLYG
jgi:hypothetical protein